MPATTSTAAQSLSSSGLRRVLAILCVTQITSWGILYYAFPVLAPDIARATGWPTTAVVAALSGAQLVTAVAGIPVGRWLDRRGPRAVMTTGSILGVLAVLAAVGEWEHCTVGVMLTPTTVPGSLWDTSTSALWGDPGHSPELLAQMREVVAQAAIPHGLAAD